MPLIADLAKRALVGRPLRSQQLHETLLPKWLALPVFCSDPISSVAYATEEIVLVLGLGGAGYLVFSKWVATAVALLLFIVVASYRQTCYAYPTGGGAYVVSRHNLGETAALTAAAALLVDYVMTVAVSVVAGVAAITSATTTNCSPTNLQTNPPVWLCVLFVAILVLANLRGVKESGRAFAIPTYAFIAGTVLMLAVAVGHAVSGGLPHVSHACQHLAPRSARIGGIFTVALILKAFASGCTALTGVEAISNGVPSFRRPKDRNAARTLVAMGAIAIVLFVGITVLAIGMRARAQTSGVPSVISQLAATTFGTHSFLFFFYQAATAGILILAANTAFNGFPVLSSILAQDGFLPRQLHNRGDRLVFSNGIILLAGFAVALIIGFNASVDKLIQLYIIGVFTSFTLSQFGMVRHWRRVLAGGSDPAERRRNHRAQLVNGTGAVATAVVLVVVLYSKLVKGAWLAVVAMVALFLLMKAISRHYRRVAHELSVDESERPLLPARVHAIVLVSKIHLPTLRALAYAKSTRPSSIEALSVNLDDEETHRLQEDWQRRDIDIPLRVLDSPFREVTRPILDYVREFHRRSPRDVVTVYIPEYVVGHWWEQLLHNQSALRLKARLLFQPNVMVTSVPWQLRSTAGRADHGDDTEAPVLPTTGG